MPWSKDFIHSGYVVKCKITADPLDFYVNTVEQYPTSFPLFVCIVCVWAYTINWWMKQVLTFFSPIFFAGRTVPEEKQEDAGHFDPLCHSHCSYYYSFWNKVLILHSSSFCFLSGCLLCICVDLDSGLGSAQNEDDCLSYSPGNKDKEELWVSSQLHFGLQESILVNETINILVELQLLNERNDMHPKHQDCDRGLLNPPMLTSSMCSIKGKKALVVFKNWQLGFS